MTRLTRIHQVAAKSGDLADALTFYRDKLGARFIAKFDPPGLLFFDFNGVRLLLEANAPEAVLYFRVDDIESSHAELTAAGIEFISEPHAVHKDDDGVFDNPGSEEWMAFFKDPAGNTLALASRKMPDGNPNGNSE
jgi:methylmalonyl-CoA/ethylmalonyl-CoA epimerase